MYEVWKKFKDNDFIFKGYILLIAQMLTSRNQTLFLVYACILSIMVKDT